MQAVVSFTAILAAEAARPRDMSFLQLLIKGGYFMLPIAAASLIGLALILERALALRRSRIVPRHFIDDLKIAASDARGAMEFCQENPCPIARIVLAGLKKLPQGPASVEKAIEDTGANELHKLRRNLRMLYGVAAIAPMMGLLGTVWGMIDAFRVTSQAKGLGRPELLATGIYEALVTTLAGLMVAIPVLMFYYYFAGKLEQIVADMNEASTAFLEHFLEDRQHANTRSA